MLGVLFGLVGQIGSFLQLQGNVKYGWYEKYPYVLLLISIPISWLYIQSVKNIVLYFTSASLPFIHHFQKKSRQPHKLCRATPPSLFGCSFLPQ